VKRWPWNRILAGIACLLILVGVAPLAYLIWFGTAHSFEPLSMPFPLKRGEYTSPYFTTDLDEDYQVEIYSLPFDRTTLELDWKIVDETGVVIQSGTYTDAGQGRGNDAILSRNYRPRRGVRQRAMVTVHQDVASTGYSDVRLHVGLPERSLESAYGSAAFLAWAGWIAGPGVLMLLVLLIVRAVRWSTRPRTASS